jgi:hypothetical protein
VYGFISPDFTELSKPLFINFLIFDISVCHVSDAALQRYQVWRVYKDIRRLGVTRYLHFLDSDAYQGQEIPKAMDTCFIIHYLHLLV